MIVTLLVLANPGSQCDEESQNSTTSTHNTTHDDSTIKLHEMVDLESSDEQVNDCQTCKLIIEQKSKLKDYDMINIKYED